jgi:hypothetical protein
MESHYLFDFHSRGRGTSLFILFLFLHDAALAGRVSSADRPGTNKSNGRTRCLHRWRVFPHAPYEYPVQNIHVGTSIRSTALMLVAIGTQHARSKHSCPRHEDEDVWYCYDRVWCTVYLHIACRPQCPKPRWMTRGGSRSPAAREVCDPNHRLFALSWIRRNTHFSVGCHCVLLPCAGRVRLARPPFSPVLSCSHSQSAVDGEPKDAIDAS